jgi:hypothetical protein
MGDKPRITADELSQKLADARKVMNKVETGNYEKGNIDESMLILSPEENMEDEKPAKPNLRPVGIADPTKINQSRLPAAIKKAMIESPIPQITLNDTLDMDFVNKTRKLMEQDGSMPVRRASTTQNKNQHPSGLITNQDVPNNYLETIIENCIRKVLDEKLSQILNAQESVAINENLVIKVGDSLFSGKITKVKSSK